LLVLTWLAVVPAAAYAQASMTGVVRDTSGAVLPGVTVEASSPALIEGFRSVVTDGNGQYRIVELGPGLYSVKFTLPGFAVVQRERIELTGSFVATVNADLRVGSLDETITVTGETPVVDVQSATRQQVLNREVLQLIPTGRSEYDAASLIPGAVNSGGHDVGGAGGRTNTPSIRAHEGRSTEARHTLGGAEISMINGSGSAYGILMNPVATEEVVLDIAAGDTESMVGGVRLNRIPREGGNRFNGTFFATGANRAMQGSNLTQDLRDRGLPTTDEIDSNWNVNAGVGGPILRDRLWFFGAYQNRSGSMFAGGVFEDRNANNPAAWTYDPDVSRKVTNVQWQKDGQARLTWQATSRHKIGLTWMEATAAHGPNNASTAVAFEAAERRVFSPRRTVVADWTVPATNRLLFEANASLVKTGREVSPWADLSPAMIGVVEQSIGFSYRAPTVADYAFEETESIGLRGVVSYILGAHTFKAGFNHRHGDVSERTFDLNPLEYRFSGGVPNQLTQRALPITSAYEMEHDMGVFAQHQWTIQRATLNYGLRYDRFMAGFPEQHAGPALLTPTRNITFPEKRGVVNFHDISPRIGIAYDLFGTGRTAIKSAFGRYPDSWGGIKLDAVNPIRNLAIETTRSWTDTNRNFVPDCDLLNPLVNGECGAMANAGFGAVANVAPGAVVGRGGVVSLNDPDMLNGWGKREYTWGFMAGVQHQLIPRVSAEVSYNRRSYQNLVVTQNRATTAADYDPFSITAPMDPRLPGGGGYVIDGLFDIKPEKFGQIDNFITRASTLGKKIEYWHGMDVSINARLGAGMLLQGGTSTGRAVRDDCQIRPLLGNPSLLYCHVAEAWLTRIKLSGAYTLPRVDIQVSGSLRSEPAPGERTPRQEIAANLQVPTAEVRRSLGRDLAGGARNVTVNLLQPGTQYGERANQLDLRLAKVLRFAGTRTTVSADIFNVLNSNAVQGQNSTYGPAWQQPTAVLIARFVKFSVLFDF
jgi:hypothetical protein